MPRPPLAVAAAAAAALENEDEDEDSVGFQRMLHGSGVAQLLRRAEPPALDATSDDEHHVVRGRQRRRLLARVHEGLVDGEELRTHALAHQAAPTQHVPAHASAEQKF